jgi:competence protein ComEA
MGLRFRRWIAGALAALGLLAAAPAWGAQDGSARRPAAAKQRLESGVKVDLNRAAIEELVRLPGIGRKRAEAIVAYRKKRPFRRVREIRKIRGVGRKTFQRLAPLITVGPVPARK